MTYDLAAVRADLKAIADKIDAATAPAPTPDPVPVPPAPVDPVPAPVPMPPIVGATIATSGQDLIDKLAAAVDGDTIGLRGEFGAVTISGQHKAVTIAGDGDNTAHFDSLKVKASSGLTFTGFSVWPTQQPVIGSVKLFNVQAELDTSDLVFDGLLLRGRADSEDWVDWTFQDWTDWRMGGIWTRGPRSTIRGCRAVGVQMGYTAGGAGSLVEDSIVFGFSDDGIRLNGDDSSAIGNTVADRVKINTAHPDGIQCFKTSGPLRNLKLTDNTVLERTQNIAPDLRTHLQGICAHNGPYVGMEVARNTVVTTSTLGIAVNNVDGLLIDGNRCTHTDGLWGKYPVIRAQNMPNSNWVVTNNIGHTFILPTGSWIMKPAPGNNTNPVYP